MLPVLVITTALTMPVAHPDAYVPATGALTAAYGTMIEPTVDTFTFPEPAPTPPPKPAPGPRPYAPAGNVERWRPLVAEHFHPADVDMALRVIACESGGNPLAKNRRSSASGLFQHLRGWWSGQWGLPAFDPFDPEQSIAAGAALRYRRGSWADWNASRGCWG